MVCVKHFRFVRNTASIIDKLELKATKLLESTRRNRKIFYQNHVEESQ